MGTVFNPPSTAEFDRGTNWEEGENQAGYSADVLGQKAEIMDGTNASPDTETGPTFKVSRTSAVTQATIDAAGSPGTDGGDQLAAVMGVHVGKAASETQTVGVAGFAKNASNSTENPDACGLYGVGRITGGNSEQAGAFGAYLVARRDVATATATGLEIQAQNYTATPGSYKSNGSSDTKGIWLNANGESDSGVGIQIQNAFGKQFKVGLGFGNQETGGKKGGVAESSIRDDSESTVSVDVRGKHSKAAVRVLKEAGSILVGAEELSTTTSQLLELHGGGASHDPILKITAGANALQSILFNNSTGNVKLGQAGAANNLLTGTVAGDFAVQVIKETGVFHIGRNEARATLRVGSSLGIGAGAADSFGGGVGVIFIANRGTKPESNPTGGGILYTEEGKLMYRGSSGTVKELATA